MNENTITPSQSQEPTTRALFGKRRVLPIALGAIVLVIAVFAFQSYLQIQRTRQVARQIADGTYPFQNDVITPNDPRFSVSEAASINDWGYKTAAELQEMARQFNFQFDVSTIHSGGTYPDEPDRIAVRFTRPDGIYGVTVVRGTYADAWSLRTPAQQEDFQREYNDYNEFERLAEEVLGNWMPPKPRPRAAIEMLTRRREFRLDLSRVLEPGGLFVKDFAWQGWKWTLGRDEDGYRRYLRFHIPNWGNHYPEQDINRTRD